MRNYVKVLNYGTLQPASTKLQDKWIATLYVANFYSKISYTSNAEALTQTHQ